MHCKHRAYGEKALDAGQGRAYDEDYSKGLEFGR